MGTLDGRPFLRLVSSLGAGVADHFQPHHWHGGYAPRTQPPSRRAAAAAPPPRRCRAHALLAAPAGVPFSGSDIGGFVWLRPPTPELWIRWAQVRRHAAAALPSRRRCNAAAAPPPRRHPFPCRPAAPQLGAVSGHMHMQTGGTSLLGADKSTIQDTPLGSALWRRYAKLRTALYPYLRGAAAEAVRSGMPLMRHHLLSFPRDPQALRQVRARGPARGRARRAHRRACRRSTSSCWAARCSPRPWWSRVPPSSACTCRRASGARCGGRTSCRTQCLKRQSAWPPRWLCAPLIPCRLRCSGLWRIGRAELVPGGQHREVAAPLTHLPLWARAGSIVRGRRPPPARAPPLTEPLQIPTLLPDVHSLAPAPADRAAGVVFLADRAHTRVLWVFPDATVRARAVAHVLALTGVLACAGRALLRAWRRTASSTPHARTDRRAR